MMWRGLLGMILMGGLCLPVSAGEVPFRDDFDGDALGEAWEVVGADPEGMIVEEGMLQIVTQVPEKKLFDARNLVLYRGELPREYEVEARVLMTQVEGDCTKWHEAPFVGLLLRRDGDNAIALVAAHSAYECVSRKDAVVFARVKGGRWQPWFWADIGPQRADRPVRLKLVRKGRVFIGYYLAQDKQGRAHWRRVGFIPLIRAEGYRLGLIAARSSGKTREQLDKVDWVEIRPLQRVDRPARSAGARQADGAGASVDDAGRASPR